MGSHVVRVFHALLSRAGIGISRVHDHCAGAAVRYNLSIQADGSSIDTVGGKDAGHCVVWTDVLHNRHVRVQFATQTHVGAGGFETARIGNAHLLPPVFHTYR